MVTPAQVRALLSAASRRGPQGLAREAARMRARRAQLDADERRAADRRHQAAARLRFAVSRGTKKLDAGAAL